MALLKWFKKKFINDSEGSDSDSDEVTDEENDDEGVQDELDDASVVVDDALTNDADEMSQNDSMDYDFPTTFEQFAASNKLNLNQVQSRSRSSSTASNSTVTYTTHQPHYLCSMCEPCKVSRYKVNPFTDIQVVSNDGQVDTSMVKSITSLMEPDEIRDAFYSRNHPFLVAGSCDDGSIIVFDIHCILPSLKLVGHRLPVTCMLKVDRYLISASHDKTLKIWNYRDGTCLYTCQRHKNAIKFLALLDSNKLCSGGNDVELCVWNISNGEFSHSIERKEEEGLNALISLDAERICTASDSRTIHVYGTNPSNPFHMTLSEHDHPVQCLSKVNDTSFVSASSDGVIILWDSTCYQAKRTLNKYKLFLIPPKTHTAEPPPPARKGMSSSMSNLLSARKVNQIVLVNEKYLCAAIGRGFNVFDLETGACILHHDDAHRAQVDKLIVLHKGNLLATFSSLGCEIKIWNTNRIMSKKKRQQHDASNQSTSSSLPLQATLLSQETLHVKPVKDLISLCQYGFASCGDACELLIWRDVKMEKRLRSRRQAIQQQHVIQNQQVKRILFGEQE